MVKNYPTLNNLALLFFLLFTFTAFSQTVLYSENFESGGGGWGAYIGVGGGNTKWNYSNATNYNTGASGNYVFTDPNYAKNILNGVVSPVINLLGSSNITFQFDIWYNTEVNYDGMKVEYSLNNGAWTAWADLGSMSNTNWYNTIDVNAFSPYSGNPDENGWSGNSGGWVTRSINLSAENILFNSSSQFQFRIIFASDNNVENVGVAFDNILIVGNSGIDFIGTKNDYVDFGNNHNFGANAPFSLEAWVLQATNTTGTRTIISKGNAKSGNLRGYHLFLDNGKATFTWYNNSGAVLATITSPNAITNGKWYHISLTYNGSIAKIYVDGVDVVPDGVEFSSLATGSQSFLIGAMYDDNAPNTPKNNFDGYIDEVRVWDLALSEQQIREMMNQEIQINAVTQKVKGKKIPIDISGVGLTWEKLKGYYPMNDNTANDKSNNGTKHGLTRNMVTFQPQTAPLPYKSTSNGSWDSETTWLNGTVQNPPNSMGINGSTKIDWNVVETAHNITSGAKDITVLGLISTAGKLTIANPTVTTPIENNSGQSLRVTHYLELDGEIDLVGESQLLQDPESILDQDSGGYIERDQQGTANGFNYNYWSSSVGPISGNTSTRGTGVASTNASYNLGLNGKTEGLMDGTSSSSPVSINFQPSHTAADSGPSTPSKTISTYWLYTFYGADDNYWAWKSVKQNTPIFAGEGYTMKGTSGAAAIATMQNYVFRGKPNNGDIILALDKSSGDVDRLIGNPYPSALDANEFIKDHIKTTETINGNIGRNTVNVFNGALYFWDHFGAINSHNLGAYVGGYATYTLMGGTKAIADDKRINTASGLLSSKVPERYIPVGQGFFVITALDAKLAGETTATVDGGTITFKNSQRYFKREGSSPGIENTGSVFMKNSNSKKESAQSNAEVDSRPKIRLLFHSPKGYNRHLLIGTDENTTNNFDIGYDGLIADTGSEDMFWMIQDAKFVIQGVPNFNTDQEFPLGLKIAKSGLATIKIDALENMDEDISLHIKDKLTGETHNISQKPFEINLEPGTYLDRFALTFKTQKLVAEDFSTEVLKVAEAQTITEGIHVFMNNAIGELQIKINSTEEILSVALINSLGQTLKTWNSNFNTRTISLPISTATGVYLVQINTKTGKTVKKISVE